MLLDVGSLQAARLSDIKLDMLLDVGSRKQLACQTLN